MKKSEKYDIKEASNQDLTASARKNYSENAEAGLKMMGGTSMGSSGINMCGSQVGKHMGGPKMMGGDGKRKLMEKMPSAHESKISKQMGFADKIGGMIKQNMAGTGSPDLSLNTATYAMNKAFNKAQDLKKEGPLGGLIKSSGVSSKYFRPKYIDRSGKEVEEKLDRRGNIIKPDMGPVPKTLTKKEARKIQRK